MKCKKIIKKSIFSNMMEGFYGK
jgi:hypothetical protein